MALGDDVKEVALLAEHGGQCDLARRLFPQAPEPWLDLSTGINAVAYPLPEISAAAWTRLPDAEALLALEVVAGLRYGVPEDHMVVAAPGTQALIQRLPVLCKGRDVRVLGPTFGEFERVFRTFDRIVRLVPRVEALAGADVAIVVNPNNPDGRFVGVDELLDLSRRVGKLIVDEAFVDAMPMRQSVVPRLTGRRIIVLRSFGKIYGLAGLRLGFAILAHQDATTLRTMLGPWPLSGPALEIGVAAFADHSWLESTRSRLATDATRLMFLLRHVGVTLVGGTPLFRLIAHPMASTLFDTLARRGILTRPFAYEPTWLRFGFPGTEDDWKRLEAALLAFR